MGMLSYHTGTDLQKGPRVEIDLPFCLSKPNKEIPLIGPDAKGHRLVGKLSCQCVWSESQHDRGTFLGQAVFWASYMYQLLYSSQAYATGRIIIPF